MSWLKENVDIRLNNISIGGYFIEGQTKVTALTEMYIFPIRHTLDEQKVKGVLWEPRPPPPPPNKFQKRIG